MDDQIVKHEHLAEYGHRAFTNPSTIESQRERARNRRLRQQQRQQKLVRQECSTYSGVRVVNSTHDLVSPGGCVLQRSEACW
ncbi:Uncharacterized protein HZ326_30708 [Fusarium oxysporum f. sp. albedinis]|nr:Uncharacterized protein HZ326_30708 [Fusarium oxysporum f. sp. albedinis]